ncbi:MAG TPA: D-glucuronyl C5-epimerase family protein [Solirubrobacteraceae bacterium]|nr:D-glucuronyl C5-epimerase family protein [Solirubrobacteraceae bacterium]
MRSSEAKAVFAVVGALVFCAPANAAEIAVLDHDGETTVREDPFLPEPRPEPHARSSRPGRDDAQPRARAADTRRTVRRELRRLESSKRLSSDEHDRYRRQYDRAKETVRRLEGSRRASLGAVVHALEDLTARGRLVSSRAPVLFETLERNRQWWTEGALIPSGRRVGFAGSELVWQHYGGQGLQVQWLGTFGRANQLFSTRQHDARLRALLAETAALATRRAGGMGWESLFRFGDGEPPWVSGMTQGTAAQAYSRGALRLQDGGLMTVAREALGVFSRRAPTGVWGGTSTHAHYLQYSYDPGLHIYNGFVQALNGIYDFAKFANDDPARTLFARGEAQLRRTLERGDLDTGGWSRYSNRRDSSLHYHRVLRDFLRGLCRRLGEGRVAVDPAPYCTLAQRFTDDLTRPPVIALRSRAATTGRSKMITFTTDKPVTVTMTIARGDDVMERITRRVVAGRRQITWDRPRRAGTYIVTLAGTDPAGNRASDRGALHVTAAR